MTLRPQIKVNNESDRLYLEMLYDNYKNLMFKQARKYFQKTKPKHFGGLYR